MTDSEITVVFADCLGTATWEYLTENKSATSKFVVSSIAQNNSEPLNLSFKHEILSSKLTDEHNGVIIKALDTYLSSLNAVDVESVVSDYTPVTQVITSTFKINNVEQANVDTLTTSIANTFAPLAEQLSINYPCSKSDVNDDFETFAGNITLVANSICPFPLCIKPSPSPSSGQCSQSPVSSCSNIQNTGGNCGSYYQTSNNYQCTGNTNDSQCLQGSFKCTSF